MSIWFWIAIGLGLFVAHVAGYGYGIRRGQDLVVRSVKNYGAYANDSGERIEGSYTYQSRYAATHRSPPPTPRPKP